MFTEYPVCKGGVRSSTMLHHKGISHQKEFPYLRHKQPAETPRGFVGRADAAELSAEKFPSQRAKLIGKTCRKELMQFNNSNAGHI